MFAYCGNNPVNRVDPTGQFWIEIVLLGAVLVGCVALLSGCGSQTDSTPLPYKTADEAAMAFANSIERSINREK